MKARIHWKTKEEGGRSQPPIGVGNPYYAVVRFKDTTGPWPPPVAWSLVVEKIVELSTEYDWVADVHFLVKEAPATDLRPGREFELYEGKRCAATGVLVGPE
jgi:hypothetical protein